MDLGFCKIPRGSKGCVIPYPILPLKPLTTPPLWEFKFNFVLLLSIRSFGLSVSLLPLPLPAPHPPPPPPHTHTHTHTHRVGSLVFVLEGFVMVNRVTSTTHQFVLFRLALNSSKGRYHVQSKWVPAAGSQLLIKPLDKVI